MKGQLDLGSSKDFDKGTNLRPQVSRVELLQKLVDHCILCNVRLMRLLGSATILHHHVADPRLDERSSHPSPETRIHICYSSNAL